MSYPEDTQRSLPHWAVVVGLGAAAGAGLFRHFFPPVETRPHVAGPSGYVDADPEGLARAAGVPLDVYVLASAMQSEEKDDRGRLAVGRAAWNATRQRRDRLVPLIIPSGRLGLNPYAATHLAPTARTLGLARAIVEGRIPDFVEHAVQWDAPALQDQRHQQYLRDPLKHPRYKSSSADVARRRAEGGMREVRVPGVPDTRFWARG